MTESNNQVLDTDGPYQKYALKREERHFRKERLCVYNSEGQVERDKEGDLSKTLL